MDKKFPQDPAGVMATKGQKTSCFPAVFPHSCPAQTVCTQETIAVLKWEEVSQVTPSTSFHMEHLCNYDTGASRSLCMLVTRRTATSPLSSLPRPWSRSTDKQRTSLALCPSSCSVPGPDSLSRASALWEEETVYISVGFLQGHGLGFCGKDLKWEGIFCEQQLPSFWPEPVPASPKTAKAVSISCLLMALGKRPWDGQWGLGQLEMWTKVFSPLHTALPACPSELGVHRRLWGDTAKQLTPSDHRDFPQHVMPCSAIKPWGWRLSGAPLAQKLAGHQFVIILGFQGFFSLLCFYLFICLVWFLFGWFCFNLVKLLLYQPTSVFTFLILSPRARKWVSGYVVLRCQAGINHDSPLQNHNSSALCKQHLNNGTQAASADQDWGREQELQLWIFRKNHEYDKKSSHRKTSVLKMETVTNTGIVVLTKTAKWAFL